MSWSDRYQRVGVISRPDSSKERIDCEKLGYRRKKEGVSEESFSEVLKDLDVHLLTGAYQSIFKSLVIELNCRRYLWDRYLQEYLC